MLLAWSSGRIGRAVRSTLSAEAYSCSEAQDVTFWTRAVCADISSANKLGYEYRQATEVERCSGHRLSFSVGSCGQGACSSIRSEALLGSSYHQAGVPAWRHQMGKI
eukprot:3477398-Pyramimonas_sp.AAC.1